MKTTRRKLLGLFLAPFAPSLAQATAPEVDKSRSTLFNLFTAGELPAPLRYPEATIRVTDEGAESVEVVDNATGEVLSLVQAVNIKEGWVEQIRHHTIPNPEVSGKDIFGYSRQHRNLVISMDADGKPIVDRKYGDYSVRVSGAGPKPLVLMRDDRAGELPAEPHRPTGGYQSKVDSVFELGNPAIHWLVGPWVYKPA